MNEANSPSIAEVNNLFDNSDPGVVWIQATNIISHINPEYDYRLIQTVFNDVMQLFQGKYPGYSSIKTLYHDMPHTLDVLMCAVRLMHGVHVSGIPLDDDEITLVMIGVLMHDIGYAQLQGEEFGTGAQYTQIHVKRGITFMSHYLVEHRVPADFIEKLKPMISCTDPAVDFSDIEFKEDRTRLLAQLLVTADLTGQMADRAYLEKLLFLYLEFKEAHFGNFQNIHEMLRQTRQFYKITREKLDGPFGGLHINLTHHFREIYGVDRNYYLESIEKNIDYLEKVIDHNEAEYLGMLKRGGIVEKFKTIADPG